MAFWVAMQDPKTNPTTEQVQLAPAPVGVEYPDRLHGDLVETADGRLIVQQPTNDNRVRSWLWLDYQRGMPGYENLYQMLLALRSVTRVQAGNQPYIWVKDDTTGKLRRKVTERWKINTSGATTTLPATPGSPNWPTNFANGIVEILPATVAGDGVGAGARRRVLSNTSSVLTIDSSVTIGSNTYFSLVYWVDDWFKARVVDVDRNPQAKGGSVQFDRTHFSFVLEDNTYNNLG